MRKIMSVVVALAAALILAGCGGKPKIPADAVVAAYIDLGKGLESAMDVAEIIIDNLPKEMAKSAKEEYEQFVQLYKDNAAQCDFDWALLAVCSSKASIEPAPVLVVKCDYAAPGKKDGKSLKDMLQVMLSNEEDKYGVKVLSGFTLAGPCKVALVDEKYLIIAQANGESALEKAVALYKDGKGETSDSFDDIAELGDDTIARVQIADAEFLIENYGLKTVLEKFGKDADDEDLVDMISDIGNITLDINFTDDTIGGVLAIDAGCVELAKLVEGVVNVGMFARRISMDILKANPEILEDMTPMMMVRNVPKMSDDLIDMMKDAVKADRSGSVVTVTLDIDTEDLVEEISKSVFSGNN